jgi:hypothetical protein
MMMTEKIEFMKAVGPREYILKGNETWIDVHDLTIHISKRNSGVRVTVYPREDDGISKPLGILFADQPKPTTESPLVLKLDHSPITATGDGTFEKRLSEGFCPKCRTTLPEKTEGSQKCKVCHLEIGTTGN